MQPIDSVASADLEIPDSEDLTVLPYDRSPPRDRAHDHDIITTAEGSPRLGMCVDFLRAAGLAPLLLEAGAFTVFAPTDRAFLKLSLRERDGLLADRSRLSRVMRGHIVLGRFLLPTTDRDEIVCSIDGERRLLAVIDGAHQVEQIRIVQANILASNGVIHAIDALLP